MLTKKDTREVPSANGTSGTRDGSHCDLCGCTTPAVRCDKCNRQVFCLSCDDMYHRHPRRKTHLRRAVDSLPPRHLPPQPPGKFHGDPTTMPVPPPRKKKSLFSAFSRSSHLHEPERHPMLPKKEFSWTDKFGSIKRFMASRPLPPVPPEDEGSPPQPLLYPRDRGPANYVNVDPIPPAVPQRPPPRVTSSPRSQQRRDIPFPTSAQGTRNENTTSFDDWDDVPSASGSTRDSDDGWGQEVSPTSDLRQGIPQELQPGFNTLQRQRHHPHLLGHRGSFQGMQSRTLQQSTSMTDLQGHLTASGYPPPPYGPPNFGPFFRGPPQFGYPMPYGMHSTSHLHYQQGPQGPFFGSTGSWSNVNSAAEDGKDTDDDMRKQRGATLDSRNIKRSHSCMHDPVLNPGQFYPFGYPGYPPQFYPPWAQPPSSPPSPSLSQHSLPAGERQTRRSSESSRRRQKKHMGRSSHRQDYSSGDQEGDEEAQSSASDGGYQKDSSTMKKKRATSTQKHAHNGRNIVGSTVMEGPGKENSSRTSAAPDSNVTAITQATPTKNDQTSLKAVITPRQEPETIEETEKDSEKHTVQTESPEKLEETERPKWDPTKPWRCEHCTFINGPGSRICLICCRTTFREETPPPSGDEEKQKKRSEFQDTLAGANIEETDAKALSSTETRPTFDSDQMVNEVKKPPTQLSSIREESKSPTGREEFTEDFIREQEEVEKEIRRRLEIQLKIDEDNRRIDQGVVEEKKTVHHFQADTPETECASAPSQPPSFASATTGTDTKVTTTGENAVYESTIEQSHSSCQTAPAEAAAGEDSAAQTTPAELLLSVRPKVLCKSSVATDTDDIRVLDTDKMAHDKLSPHRSEGSSQRTAETSRDQKRLAFSGVKAQSLEQPVPSFLQRKAEQRPSRIGNLIRTLSKTSLHTAEPGGEGRLYRSSSRSSIQSDMSDAPPVGRKGIMRHGSLAEFDRPFTSLSARKEDDTSSLVGATTCSNYFSEGRKQDYYHSLEELVQQRKQEQMKAQGFELVRMIREAEQQGFTADDLQVAMNHCGNDNPVHWLKENWRNMTETVVTLATNYGHDRRENNIGIVSTTEAQAALRRQKGNIWAAVTECVENRQRMFMELSSRGSFSREEILTALTDNQGLIDMAYAQLTKATLKPFLMRIWGPGTGVDNDEGACPSAFPAPPGNDPEESATERVKDWLDSLDASQVASYKTSPTWEKGQWQQRRRSYQGGCTEGSLRGRSSSPASSLASHPEISETSSVSSAAQETTSRLERILRRREAQKENEKGRKNRKAAGKKRWTLSTVFKGKSENHSRIDFPKAVDHSLQEDITKSNSSTASPSPSTLKRGSSSSTETVSSATLRPLEATGAKPKALLERLSPFKKDRADKVVKHTDANEHLVSQTLGHGHPNGTEIRVAHDPTALVAGSITTTAAKPDGKDIGTKSEDDTNTTAKRRDRDMKNVRQTIRDARASFLSGPLTPITLNLQPNVASNYTPLSRSTVRSSSVKEQAQTDGKRLSVTGERSEPEMHIGSANSGSINRCDTATLQNAKPDSTKTDAKVNNGVLVTVKEGLHMKGSDSLFRKTEEPQRDSTVAESVASLPAARQEAPENPSATKNTPTNMPGLPHLVNNEGLISETESSEMKGKSKEVKSYSNDRKVSTEESDRQSDPEPINDKQKSDPENNKHVQSSSSSVVPTTLLSNPIITVSKCSTGIDNTVKTQGSGSSDLNDSIRKTLPTPSTNAAADVNMSTEATVTRDVHPKRQPDDEVQPDSVQKGAEPETKEPATSVNSQTTPSGKEAQVVEATIGRRTRPPPVDESSESILARKQSRRLSDGSLTRRRERPRSQVIQPVDQPEPERLIIEEPSTATGKGLYRRPSIRRSRGSEDKGENSAMLGPDGSPIVVKPQKPIERRGSIAARPGIFISKTVAANIAKLRSVPPPKKRTHVQPRPEGKIPTDKQRQYKEKAEQLVNDGKCPSMVHAQLVAELVDMSFEEDDAITAAEQCDTIYQAVNFLQHECELCAANYPISQMISLLNCVHKACKECMKAYFTIQIRDRNIMELLCPFCNEPDLSDEDVELNYFNNLDILLKGLVEQDFYDLFQQKLRDRALMKDPNFRWCSQCSSGFITYPDQKRLVCPDCHAVTCALCRKVWQKQHEGTTCEQFQEWLDANDPDNQAEGITRYLEENGIDCPNCKFKYSLARGGCMHFKCYQCSFDFCCGCNQPFKMGEKCGRTPACARYGLHAHHPRNCLFYLRDKEITDLQKLLKEMAVPFNTDPPPHWTPSKLCQVPEQKETSTGLRDDICGKDVENDMAGLCRKHYVEYLGQLIFRHHVDPLPIFDIDELELVLKRENVRLPSRYRLSEDEYRAALIKVIDAEVPLDALKIKRRET
ncbi:E3 ubiquitin-protein ligase lubel-like isoform X2 [Ornithodoros turicata]|uniref:E3 ubiquitin-protein ligase lubel-like isoform X2 n=1 Tax=Ornithodoros turicata TaxID=34597 RepID=UPI0031389B22